MTASPPNACDDALSALLAALGPNLLQYLDAARPWTPEPADRTTLDRLAAEQRRNFAEVVDLLARRHVRPESGTFPSEFAALHYLALDFLIGRVVAGQIAVVAAADVAVAACVRDAAVRPLRAIREREAERLVELKRLAEAIGDRKASPHCD